MVLSAALLGVGALVTAPVRASMVLALSLDALTRKADVIVVAVPRERQSRMDYASKLIVTDYSLDVQTALKGEVKSGAAVIATVLGGRLDGLALPGG